MEKVRIKYFDIVKGMLILLEMFVHVGLYLGCQGIQSGNNKVFGLIMIYVAFFIISFAMPAFLVLHGYLSTKNRSFSDECKYAAVMLLLPMVLLMIGISFWFCWAMFFALVFYNVIKRVNPLFLRLILCVLLSLLGIMLSNRGFNILNIDEAMVFLPFLFMGSHCKKICDSNVIGVISAVIYLVFIIYLLPTTSYNIGEFAIENSPFEKMESFDKLFPPNISGTGIAISLREIPLFFILAITGTLALFTFSRFIGSCKPIEFIGRNSLLFLIIHVDLLIIVGHTNIPEWICSFSDSIGISILLFILSLFIVLLITTIGCIFINKFFPWVTGKGLL